MFKDVVVESCIATVWWGGAYRLDVFNVCVTMLGLAILILEETGTHANESGHERRLKPGGGGLMMSLGKNATAIQLAHENCNFDMFIGARGLVDLLHEILLLAGLITMGRGCDYFSSANMWQLFAAVVGLCFGFYGQLEIVRTSLIL